MILFLFFCSGATALIYEVLWSKYLSLMFGSTVQAQTVVLAVFMGGLALGNKIFGKRSDTMRRPLLAYGYIEVAIGLYAFCFAGLYGAVDAFFVNVGSHILERSWLLLGLKGILSVVLLLGPTILMGGTLPLLATWLQRNGVEPGRLSARFYSTNSLGAVCGAGLAGFYLIRTVGMVSTSQITALLNVLIGATAIGLARYQKQIEAASPTTEVADQPKTQTNPVVRWATVLVVITGGVSMGLEVLASRAMSLLFGSSLQSFAIVLMAFILGIGLGSAVIASPRFKKWNSETVVVTCLLAAGCWIGILIFKIEAGVDGYRWLKTGLSRGEVGYLFNQLLSGLIAMFVLGVPAALLGAVLPLLMRVVSQDAKTIGDKIGRLLTWNTLGAVCGVLTTGFILMPQVGLRNSFGVLALLLAVAAGATAWLNGVRKLSGLAAGVAGLLVVFFFSANESWKWVLSSGVFRAREAVFHPEAMKLRRQFMEILFYEDAPDATVSVERSRVEKSVNLRINGKPDASTSGDLLTQYLCAHLPMAARPDAKDVFVLGMGSGITAGSVLGHPVEQLTVAENCEPVLRTVKFFAPFNNDVLSNPRTRVWTEDARTILKLNPHQYDIIILEPSNPWTVGVGSVFSQEFYQLTASRLKKDGIIVQWFHIYEMHDGIVSLVLRTFNSVYPFIEIWDCGSGDILMLGAQQPWKTDLNNYRRVFERDLPRQQLADCGLKTPEALLGRQLASQRTAFAIAGDGGIQSDFFPVLEYEAPKAFYLGYYAARLGDFDERTAQSALAPLEKRTAVESLSSETIRGMFETYRSVNHALLEVVKLRLSTNQLSASSSPVASMPSLLRGTNLPPVSPGVPDGASEQLKELFQAAHLLETRRGDKREAIERVERLLRAYQEPASTGTNRSATFSFAVLGAKHSLGLGDYQTAKRLIELGRKSGGKDFELDYLARILDREQSMSDKLVSARH